MSEILDNPYPNRIEDPEKAHAMALAGNEDRSWAAKHNLAAVAVKEFFSGYASSSEIMRVQATRKFDQAIETLNPIISRSRYPSGVGRHELYRPSEIKYAFSGTPFSFWLREDQDQFKKELQEQHSVNAGAAESLSRSANELEDAAGFLYDHPVSEEFQAANGDISFTPYGLRSLDWNIEQAREIADEHRGYYKEFLDPEWGSKHLPRHLASIVWDDDMHNMVLDTKNGPGVEKLLNNPDTTIQQFNDYFKQSARQQAVKSAKKYTRLYKIRRAVLSGATSDS